ncbi:RNA-binding protein BRN1 [Diplonema papillatum]|nr:RNA-binding protein BRN1 [Diplonema papillatum]
MMNPNRLAAQAAPQNQDADDGQQNTAGPVKLFVGQVPGVCTEEMLQPLFAGFGTVLEVSIMRDKTTNRSKGSAWVTYADRSSAETAISLLHDQHIIPPQTNPLQIKLASSPPQLQNKMLANTNSPLYGQHQQILKQLVYLNKFGGHSHPSRGGRKLFIGQIPRIMTQEQLLEQMKRYGTVEDVVVLRDRATSQGKGCAFVVMATREEAQHAIDELHGKKTISPMHNPMQVSFADGELEDQEPKLFVGMVPYKATEDDISKVFSHYGTISEVALLKNQNGLSRGCAFVKYDTMDSAQAAVSNLHGKFKMHGGTSALTVKFADTEKEKKKRMKLKQSLGQLATAPESGRPMAAIGVPNPVFMRGQATPGVITERKASGPPGANCFVLHFPLSWTDHQLHEQFLPYGQIISATVFRDRYTGQSKGFGFVSYADPASAAQAIVAMNGLPVGNGGERLKVELKNNDKAQHKGGN